MAAVQNSVAEVTLTHTHTHRLLRNSTGPCSDQNPSPLSRRLHTRMHHWKHWNSNSLDCSSLHPWLTCLSTVTCSFVLGTEGHLQSFNLEKCDCFEDIFFLETLINLISNILFSLVILFFFILLIIIILSQSVFYKPFSLCYESTRYSSPCTSNCPLFT